MVFSFLNLMLSDDHKGDHRLKKMERTQALYQKVHWQKRKDKIQLCVFEYIFCFIIIVVLESALFSFFADWHFNHIHDEFRGNYQQHPRNLDN